MKKILVGIALVLGIFYLFPQLTSFSTISGGDYITYWPEHFFYFKEYVFSAWDPKINLGWSTIGLMHYDPYSYLIGVVGSFLQNTVLTEKLLLWIPLIALSIYSARSLFLYLFPKNNYWLLSAFIFLCNTYFLMVIGGGQITGIGFAYALAPLVMKYLFKTFEEKHTRDIAIAAIVSGLLFSLQILFDLRITYITLVGAAIYIGFLLIYRKIHFRNVLIACIIPLAMLFLHMFWILPLMLFRQNPIEQFGVGHATVDILRFLSFANFENTISLLHPNWPENIFGKVAFMKAEFLVLPLLAFSSLLFINRKKHSHILYFVFLALAGAFLAKGAKEPFGDIYIWLFDTVPGFVMFRDPTKWYLLTSVSFAVLIPFSIQKIRDVSKYPNIVLVGCILLLLITIRPAVSRQLGGTFSMHQVPAEYEQLREFISSQNDSFRTMWVPQQQRFGYFSEQHPILNAHEMLGTFDREELYKTLGTERAHEFTIDAGVKYIIVPADVTSDIFLNDRKYSEKEYKKAVTAVSRVPWLTHVQDFGKIKVYAVDEYRDRFSFSNNSEQTYWKMLSPVHYQIEPKNGTIDELLIFSERFDPAWVARYDGRIVNAKQYRKFFNSFAIKGNPKRIEVYYSPQLWVNRGLIISEVSLTILLVSLFILKRKKKNI